MKRCRKCAEDDQGAFYASRNTICKPCHNANGRAWDLANPERNAARVRQWQKDNPVKMAAKWANKRASKLQRTPVWAKTAEEALAVEKLHRLAQAFTRASGVPYVVDHVLPMKGKKVTGFHLAANMQVMTHRQNATKSNRYEP